MAHKKKTGKIIVPKGALVRPHEIDVAKILSYTGHNVEFIPARNIPTPDIKFEGSKWEIKSPQGTSSRTLENNIRTALKQSENIIIDLNRMKLPEEKCLREIRRQNTIIRGKHRIMIVTKKQEIIKLF